MTRKLTKDITEHKRVQDALRESQENFEALAENAFDGIMVAAGEGVHVYANKRAAEITGYSVTELLRTTIKDLVHPDEFEKLSERYRRRLEGRVAPSPYETVIIRKDGRSLPIELTGTRTIWQHKPSDVVFFRDITERKKAEEARRESEEKYRSLYESSRDGITFTDMQGNILDVNQAYADILGYTKEEIRKLTYQQLTPEKWREMEATIVEHQIVQRGYSDEYEKEYIRKDGAIVPVSIRVWLIRDEQGKPLGMWEIVRDITKHKRAEEELRRQAVELTALQATVLDITSQQDLPTLLQTIVERAARLLGRFSGGIYLCDSKKRELRLVASHNPPRDYTGTVLKYGEGAAGHVAQTGSPLIIDDYRTWPGRAAAYEKDKELFNAVLTVPMTWQGEVTGALYVLDNVKSRRFTQADQELLAMFASHAAIAVDRKRVEETIRLQKDLLQHTFNSMTDAVFVLEAKAPPNAPAILECNEAASTIFGYDKLEMLGKTSAFLHENDETLREFQSLLYPAVEGGRLPLHLPEFRMKRKDGSIFPSEHFVAQLLNEKGERTGWVSVVRDITERKRMEEEIRKLSQLRESVIDNANVWLDVLDEKANVVIWNKAAEAMSGYSREEVVGHGKIWEWLYPDEEYRKSITDLVADVIQHGRVEEGFETKIRRKDGQTRIISWNERNLLNEHGKVIGSIALGRDVTERKKMEEELRRYSLNLEQLVLKRTEKLAESERRLQYVISSNPAVIYAGKPLADRSDFVLTYLSERVAAMLGFEPREFIGHPEFWERHVHPEDVRSVLGEIPLLWEKGQHAFEYRFLHKDGTYRWIREEANVVRDGDGKPVEVNGYWTDVTERKQMEEELRAARERLEHLITSNPAVIYTGRPRPDFSDFDATYMSRSVVSLLGFRPQDLIRRPEMRQDRVHPDDLRRYYAELPHLWKEGEHTFEYRFLHKDGNYLWIREQAKVIRDAAGKPAEVMGYWSDISEEKEMDEIRDRFISAVTHELRTPLISMSGYLDLVLSGESGPVSSEVKSNLEVVKRNTDRLASLTDELLDVQRLQSGKLQVNLQTIDFREMIKHAASEIKPFIKAKKQHFNVTVPRRPLLTLGDPVRLSQVLMNLLNNASKFTPEGGIVRLTVRDDEHIVVVKVADTGIGLRKEDLAKVFEPFAAIKKPTHIKGTGLGLSVTKGLVEAHTGRIWAESPGEGKGTTFTFALPKRGVK